MATLFIECIVILALIAINAFLAMSELAIVSAKKHKLQKLSDSGSKSAKVALDLTENSTQFLATIQFGITLVGILAGAFGGARIATVLEKTIRDIPSLSSYAGELSLGLVVSIITVITIIFGELIPKKLALNYSEQMALLSAKPVYILTKIGMPFVKLLSFATVAATRLLGIREVSHPTVTEEEVRILVKLGAETGVFEAVEETMIKRVMRLGDQNIGEIMTPRTQMTAINLDEQTDLNVQKILSMPHSILPVYKESLDNIVGVISAKSILNAREQGKKLDLAKLITKPLFLAESMPVLKVLEHFKKSGKRMGIVVDEYGGTAGIVTVMDVLTSIVGDIPEDLKHDHPEAIRRDDGTWLVDGLMNIEHFKDLFQIEALPREDEGDFQTIGGFVMTYLARVPKESDFLEWDDWYFEVMDMDGHRVDKILVKVPENHLLQ